MPDVIPFAFEGRQVCMLMIDGEPWFVVADLCTILEIQNPRDVAAMSPE
jgi:anti-repressor protein